MNPDVAMSIVKVDGIKELASSVTEILNKVIREVETHFVK